MNQPCNEVEILRQLLESTIISKPLYLHTAVYRASREKAKSCTVNRGHGKSGEVNTCSIVKHDIGGTQ